MEQEQKKHILLVDDDNDILMLMGRWLRKEYQVGTAQSGGEALDYICENRPDLVLLDYSMPEMSGPETLEKIRMNPNTADLPVVFLTGMEDAESEEQVRNLSPHGFWSKSMGKKKLLPAIEKLLLALDD